MSKKTKIVATLGPASESPIKIRSLINAGVNVFRYNLKHNSKEWHGEMIERVQSIADSMKKPIAILYDLIGRDLRLGKTPNGGMQVRRGEVVTFADEKNLKTGEIPVRSFFAYKNLKAGTRFSADSGKFHFRVTQKTERYFKAKVIQGGFLKENKGVNFPELEVDLPALLENDLDFLSEAVKHDIDYVALSFVCTGEDMRVLRKELAKLGVRAKIMAKIESNLGIKNFDDILDESDGIMVARGDLGIEVPIEKVPVLQKMMIDKCLQQGKPVITATQMMESMMENLVPSRSDVSDVANAVFDLTDCVMLSGESAAGKYPVQTVRQMAKVLVQAEKQVTPLVLPDQTDDKADAVVQAALQLSYFKPKEGKRPSAIVVITQTGRSARLMSRLRPSLPIIALTPDKKVRDELCLTYGVEPYYLNLGHGRLELAKVFEFLKDKCLVKKGDVLIIVAGEITGEPGKTNMVTIKEVWD